MLRPIVTLAVLACLAGPVAADGGPSWLAALHREGPGVRVWTSSGDLFRRGERVRVFFRTERDAYVTVFRVDTDGRVRVLFPRVPDDDNWVAGGTTYQVSNYDRGLAFVVDDYPGVGYVFGVASAEAFDYHSMLAGSDEWNVQAVSGGRVHGDPLASLEEMAQQLLPSGYSDFDDHLVPYYVDQRYDYPRFVCYDCHAYTPFAYWNPYLAWCPRYSLVVFNDPWYYYPSYWYPTRYYGGTRVVYVAPTYRSRYVFKSRESSAPGIQYRDRRNDQGVAGTGRRADFPGVHGAAFGGTGSIPAPRNLGGMEPGRRVAAGADAPGAVGAQSPADGGRRRASPGGTGSAQPVITTPGQGARRRAEIDAPAGPSRQQNEPRGDNPRRSAIERPDVQPPQPGSTKDNGRAGADRRQADQPAQPRDNPSSGREARPQPRNEAPRSAPQPRNEAPRSAPQPRNEAPRSAPQPRNEAPRSAPAPQSRGSDRPAPSPGLVRRRP